MLNPTKAGKIGCVSEVLYIYKDDTQILVNGNQILYSVNSLVH